MIHPSPSQVGQRPPGTLKENRPGLYPRLRDSSVPANRRRTRSNRPVYVATLERGVRPMGFWSMPTTRRTRATSPATAPRVVSASVCSSRDASSGACSAVSSGWAAPPAAFAPARASSSGRACPTSVDLPAPETPVTAVRQPRGIRASVPSRLCRCTPVSSSHPVGVRPAGSGRAASSAR